MIVQNRATVEDLYRIKGKAELVNGEIITEMPTGGMPSYASGEIFISLRYFLRQKQLPGIAISDNAGFLVDLPNRQSFSPDACYYIGDIPSMRFYNGAPVFAVEVCSENDYGQAMERVRAQKRADYFLAGTQVVWDVDLLGEDIIRVYRDSDPMNPTIYRRGDIAEAEPAVPGWTMSVNDLFP